MSVDTAGALVVKRLILESYLAFISNSIGTEIFRNFYITVDGKKEDAMRDGWLSCALYVSSILVLFRLADGVHGTVDSTISDLEKSGWKRVRKPRRGCILVWGPFNVNRDGIAAGHKHIGFYIGKGQAVSNDSWKKHPISHPWTFGGARTVEMILWNPSLKQAQK
jgi:hypothetical protein